MKYCPDCGEEIPENAAFCPECGAELKRTKRTQKKSNKTSLGLEENLEGALAYLLVFVSGIILYFIEEKSYFVRFHAFQSTIIFLGLFIVGAILSPIPIFGAIVGAILGIIGFIVWVVGMIKAYKGELYKFPIVGDIAEDHIEKNRN